MRGSRKETAEVVMQSKGEILDDLGKVINNGKWRLVVFVLWVIGWVNKM